MRITTMLYWMFVSVFAGAMPAALAGPQEAVEDFLDRVAPVYTISAQDVLSGTSTEVTVEWHTAMVPTITVGGLAVDVRREADIWLAVPVGNEDPAFAVSFTIDKGSGVPVACFDFTGPGSMRLVEEIEVDGVVGNFRVSRWTVPASDYAIVSEETMILLAPGNVPSGTKCGCFRGSGTCTQTNCDENDECKGGTSGATGQCMEIKTSVEATRPVPTSGP